MINYEDPLFEGYKKMLGIKENQMLLYKFDLLIRNEVGLTDAEALEIAKQSVLDDVATERHFKPGWETRLIQSTFEYHGDEEKVRHQFEVHGEYEEDSAPFIVEEEK